MKTTNTRVQSRTEEQRELNTREEEWTFEEPNALDIPKSVEKKFEAEGMRLHLFYLVKFLKWLQLLS
jgi:hypothetical protein